MTMRSASERTMGNPRYSSVSSRDSAASLSVLSGWGSGLTDTLDTPALYKVDDVLHLGHDVLGEDRVTAVAQLVVEERVLADVDPRCSRILAGHNEGEEGRTLVDAALGEEVTRELGHHHFGAESALERATRRGTDRPS